MRKKRAAILAVTLSVLATVAAIVSPVSIVAASTASFVSLGADLTAEQKSNVLDLLNISADDLTDDNTVAVTNQEEHEYLDSLMEPSVIGTRALSSAKVNAAFKGHGIEVETHNITYLTPDMYKMALATAGVKDADIVVAAPSPTSGTAALVGAMKAYARMSGQVIEPQVLKTATAELLESGELAEALGDPDKAEELISVVKQIVVENDLNDPDAIRDAVNNVAGQLGVTLSDEEVSRVTDLMTQISALDINVNDLVEQARTVYERAAEGGLDLSEYGISYEDMADILNKSPGLIERLINWLKTI